MIRSLLLALVLIAAIGATSVQDTFAQDTSVQTRPHAATAATRSIDAIDPQVLQRLRVANASAHRSLVVPSATTPPPAPAPDAAPAEDRPAKKLTVDLGALNQRISTVKETNVFRKQGAMHVSKSAETVALGPGEILAVQRNEPAATEVSNTGVSEASSSTILYTVDRSGRTRELGLVHK